MQAVEKLVRDVRPSLWRWTRRFRANGRRLPAAGGIGYPGPQPARVVEVFHPGSVRGSTVNREAVTAMVDSGLPALTGAPTAVDAWRSLFGPGDVVGIKVNPVGRPLAISSFALVHAVAAGLARAGVRPRDIVVFDRFRRQLRAAGYIHHLPSGVRWDGPSEDWDAVQLALDGYDPDVYCDLPLPLADGRPPRDERQRRSHLCLLVSRHVNKVVNLPVLKDHGVAGVSLALKNISHGFVNNVHRSHSARGADMCDEFIPAVCALPAIRRKVVLNILDGTHAVFDGGPSARAKTTWAHRTLYFATDPVALDVVGRAAIDAKRVSEGLPPVAQARAQDFDGAPVCADAHRQPQHIERAATLGLGVADPDRIVHRRLTLGQGGCGNR